MALRLISILAWTLLTTSAIAAEPTPRPNVVFIVLDAARADHFSSYGYPRNTTPEMDGIARKGAAFLNNFSPDTHTPESLPRIMSSRYYSLRFFNAVTGRSMSVQESPLTIFQTFDAEQTFLAQLLAGNGYRTALFTDQPALVRESDFAQQFDDVFTSSGFPHQGDLLVVQSADWMRKNRARPFFAYLHFLAPHSPYPEKYAESGFLPDAEIAAAVRRKMKDLLGRGSAEGWTEEELGVLRGLYDSNLRYADKLVGQIHGGLDKLGVMEDTVFIITADHGENLGDHGSIGHEGLPWDSVTHVPLIIAYPRKIPAGKIVSGLTESVDIVPTIVDMAGLQVPEGKSLDGQSLMKSMNPDSGGREAVFTNYSLRTAGYKWLVKGALFDLYKDPGETTDIAEQQSAIAEDLSQRFRATLGPYHDRFLAAKRTGPPEHPFFYIMSDFTIDPKEGVRRDFDLQARYIPPGDFESPWLVWRTRGLYRNPSRPSPAISLSAPLPNGRYRAAVMVEAPAGMPPEKIKLRYHYDPAQPFRSPKGVPSDAGIPDPGKSLFEFDLGEIRITDERFTVIIDFSPPPGSHYSLRRIEFEPPQRRKSDAQRAIDEKNSRDLRVKMREIGYWNP